MSRMLETTRLGGLHAGVGVVVGSCWCQGAWVKRTGVELSFSAPDDDPRFVGMYPSEGGCDEGSATILLS